MNSLDMATALLARGPHPDIGESHNTFAPFVGSWDVEVFDLEDDGSRRVSRGEWHFSWILEGRAMQDVLVVPRRLDRRNHLPLRGNRCATTLRIFDPAEGNWRVFFFNPVAQAYDLLRAQREGANVVQIGIDTKGRALRQMFSGITADAFNWRREIARADGQWQLLAEYSARRQP